MTLRIASLSLCALVFASTSSVAEPAPQSTPPIGIPQATIPDGCNIKNAFGWTATIDAQPPERPRLGVSGTVSTSQGGYKFDLSRKGTDFNPRIVTLELTVTPGFGITIPTNSKVTGGAKDVLRDTNKVIIRCGNGTLAEITDITVLD